jgi:hypothetical protein
MFRLLLIAAVLAMTSPALAGDPADKPAGVVASATTLKATVDAIDYDKRTVVLRSEDGKSTTTLDVGPGQELQAGEKGRRSSWSR